MDEHIHFHNEMTDCKDYRSCKGCHCHLQDENHTACCKGEGAREMYERRQQMLEEARVSRR